MPCKVKANKKKEWISVFTPNSLMLFNSANQSFTSKSCNVFFYSLYFSHNFKISHKIKNQHQDHGKKCPTKFNLQGLNWSDQVSHFMWDCTVVLSLLCSTFWLTQVYTSQCMAQQKYVLLKEMCLSMDASLLEPKDAYRTVQQLKWRP